MSPTPKGSPLSPARFLEPSRRLVALLLCLGFAACARDVWVRSGSNEEDLLADEQACMKESGSKHMNLSASLYIDRCLEERGWTRSQRGAVAASPADAPSASPADRDELSFDECFARCRELTDRSKEQCFDTCLAAE